MGNEWLSIICNKRNIIWPLDGPVTGGVQDQIDATVESAVALVKGQLPRGDSRIPTAKIEFDAWYN